MNPEHHNSKRSTDIKDITADCARDNVNNMTGA